MLRIKVEGRFFTENCSCWLPEMRQLFGMWPGGGFLRWATEASSKACMLLSMSDARKSAGLRKHKTG